MQLASYLERGPLMWKMLLHLHVDQNCWKPSQFRPRSVLTKHQPLSGSKLLDTLILKNISRQQKNMKNYPVGKELINPKSGKFQRFILCPVNLSYSPAWKCSVVPDQLASKEVIWSGSLIKFYLHTNRKTSSPMGNDCSPWSQHNVWRHHNLRCSKADNSELETVTRN